MEDPVMGIRPVGFIPETDYLKCSTGWREAGAFAEPFVQFCWTHLTY